MASSTSKNLLPMPDPECYICLHHIADSNGNPLFIILPSYAEANNDSIQVKFNSSTPLMRTAPIYSYENSGPRTVQLHFELHRDMIDELNYANSSGSSLISSAKRTIQNVNTNQVQKYTDYVDILAKEIQAAALPTYSTKAKMVNPPLVSVKLGNELFIKGVVSGQVGVSYGLPILANNKYALVTVDFALNEVAPYDAEQVIAYGSYRGISTTLESTATYTTNATAWTYAQGTSITYGALAGNNY